MSGRYRLHDAVDRQDGEGELDMRHGHDRAPPIEDELHPLIEESQPEGDIVEDAIGLKQDHPGSGPHEERGPEGKEDQDHQEIGGARGKAGEQIGDRVAQEQGQDGDQRADPEGAQEHGYENRLIGRGAHDVVIGVQAQIGGREKIERRDRLHGPIDRRPGVPAPPDRVDRDHRVFPGTVFDLGELATGLDDDAANAADLVVQALADEPGVPALMRGAQIDGEGCEDLFRREVAPVPERDGLPGLRHQPGQLWVIGGLQEQGADGQNEGDRQEREQGQDQQDGADPAAAIDPLQPALQCRIAGRSDAFADRRRCGHGSPVKEEERVSRSSFAGKVQVPLAIQSLNRLFSCSPLSPQNSASMTSVFLVFSGAVGRSLRTSGAMSGIAAFTVGP